MADAPRLPVPTPRDAYVVAPRPADETAEGGSVVLLEELRLAVYDARSALPLGFGGFLKSVEVKASGGAKREFSYGDPDTFFVAKHPGKDAPEKPVEPKKPAKGADAKTKTKYSADYAKYKKALVTFNEYHRAKKSFYRFATASLVRLGAWTKTQETYDTPLGEAILAWYRGDASIPASQKLDINDVVGVLHERLEKAMKRVGSPGRVSPDGLVRIPLPTIPRNQTLSVKVEFYDLKFLTDEDLEPVLGGTFDPLYVGGLDLGYEATPDGDVFEKDSSTEFSGWKLHLPGQPKGPSARFRNFATFELTPDARTSPLPEERPIFCLTWCPPAFTTEATVRRSKVESSPDEEPPASMVAAIPTLFGFQSSSFNYGVFGLFRSAMHQGKLYYRLHTGIDVAGSSRKDPTPVFAINGGKVHGVSVSLGMVTLFHREIPQATDPDHRLYTRYAHMQNGKPLDDGSASVGLDLASAHVGKWLKAGTRLGFVGRVKSGSEVWPREYPSHVHFETLSHHHTGWGGHSGGGNKSFVLLSADEQKHFLSLVTSGLLPANPKMPRTENVRYQYALYAREPGVFLAKWVERQLPGASGLYAPLLPSTAKGSYLIPCRQEYGHSYTGAAKCTCSCTKAGAAGKAQRDVASVCWAIRTSKDPAKSVCPYFKKSPDKAFTKGQLIQYHLWRWDEAVYAGAFDGSLGLGSLSALMTFFERRKAQLPALGVGEKYLAALAKQETAEKAAAKKKTKKDITNAVARERAWKDKKLRAELAKLVTDNEDLVLADLKAATG